MANENVVSFFDLDNPNVKVKSDLYRWGGGNLITYTGEEYREIPMVLVRPDTNLDTDNYNRLSLYLNDNYGTVVDPVSISLIIDDTSANNTTLMQEALTVAANYIGGGFCIPFNTVDTATLYDDIVIPIQADSNLVQYIKNNRIVELNGVSNLVYINGYMFEDPYFDYTYWVIVNDDGVFVNCFDYRKLTDGASLYCVIKWQDILQGNIVNT